jgi:hypothetical protein
MIEVSKRKVSRSGVASVGWRVGYGYVQGRFTVKADVWCVLEDGKILVECRSKAIAERVAKALGVEVAE